MARGLRRLRFASDATPSFDSSFSSKDQSIQHDVAGADGVSGVGNFQWAAQGGLDQTASGDGSFNLPNLNTDLALNLPNLNLQQTLSV
ncbi:hypothetical protein P0D72_22355 [Paraburkholderia sediminicola]|uniref:hypothetical protein n=1 Tax=Paraburkholderia sediminicola TaxID=458836 RepID=UPI0038BAE664